MKLIRFFTIAFLILSFFSCEKEEVIKDYPTIPELSFISFTISNANEYGIDILIFRFSYKDGDADLGYVDPFVEPWIFVKDANDNFIHYGTVDTLPAYNCRDWGLEYNGNEGKMDTLYQVPNPEATNFYMDLYVYENGKEKKIDFLRDFCAAGFNARFKDVNNPNTYPGFPFKVYAKNQFEGEMEYKFLTGLRYIVGNNPFKFKMSVRDNAMNFSNVIETEIMELEI